MTEREYMLVTALRSVQAARRALSEAVDTYVLVRKYTSPMPAKAFQWLAEMEKEVSKEIGDLEGEDQCRPIYL